MTDEQINIAIAEACGWKGHPFCKDMMGNPFPGWDTPPDYCNDLNAMHEAEMVLSNYHKVIKNQSVIYFHLLHDIAGNLAFRKATARQRAEAFLKTIGKWEEAKEL